MHYALCFNTIFSLCILQFRAPNPCISRNMHYNTMHYENYDCTLNTLAVATAYCESFNHLTVKCAIYNFCFTSPTVVQTSKVLDIMRKKLVSDRRELSCGI